MRALALAAAVWLLAAALPATGRQIHVAPGGTGTGTAAAPFGRIQQALDAAQPGDTILVRAGEYREALRTAREGTAGQPITLRADGARGSVIVTAPGRVLTVVHPHLTVEGIVLDGQFGRDDIVRIWSAAHGFTLRDSEVRKTTNDAIDMAGPHDVLIERTLIHSALNAQGGRRDAHGIAAGAVRNLVIRDTEIHTFSGDAVQVDPGRAAPGWADVTIEGSRFWLAPLPQPMNGFPAGAVPGENALDTKASPAFARARITVRDTTAWGFRGGLINNMAAFNMKEHIDAVFDRVTVHDSEIAFRLRGGGPRSGAHVRVQNAVVYDSDTAFRYEDNIENVRIWNVTVGAGVGRPFQAASSPTSDLDVRNFLLLGPRLPSQAMGPSNLAVPASAFVNAAAHDYRLAPGSPAIEKGVRIPEVTHDRAGMERPQRSAVAVGAYER